MIDRRTGSRPVLILAASLAALLAAFVGVAISSQPVPDERTFEDTEIDEVQGCERGNWPRDAFGAPKEVGSRALSELAIWLDFDGWHIRNGTDRAVTGKIYAVGPAVISAEDSDGTGDGNVVPSALEFSLPAKAVESGVDFAIGCDFYVLTFEVLAEAGPFSPERMRLGQNGSVSTNPFTIRRELPK